MRTDEIGNYSLDATWAWQLMIFLSSQYQWFQSNPSVFQRINIELITLETKRWSKSCVCSELK